MHARKRKLIKPGLQLRLVFVFLCTAGLAVQVQAILLAFVVARMAERLPNDGSVLLAQLPDFVRTNLLLTFAVLVPLTVAVGVVATFRIAGPLYRFERFLKAVRDGQQSEPCRLRKGDELTELCELLNEVTAEARARRVVAGPQARTTDVDAIAPAIPSASNPHTIQNP